MEENLLEVRDGPVVRDWDAIDLMAYGRKGDAVLCPLCGGQKNSDNWTCFKCNERWGFKAKTVIQLEIGTRNLTLWDRFVGDNLSIRHNGLKSKPVQSKEVPHVSVLETEPSATVKNVAIIKEETEPVSAPTQTLPIQKEVIEEPSEPKTLEVRIVRPAPKRAGLNGTNKQASTVNWKGGGKMILSTEKLACALTEGDRARISERRIEIFPDFWVLDDVLEVMANWSLHKRVLCPICGDYKQLNWWMCDRCAAEENARTSRWLLQFEISQRNPHASFVNGSLLSPKQREFLREQVVEFLDLSFGEQYYGSPGRLVRAASSFPAIPDYKLPVASFVIGRVALEAIFLKEGGSPERLELMYNFNRSFSVPLDPGFRGDIVGEEEEHFSEPADAEVPLEEVGFEPKETIALSEEVEQLLGKIGRNLNEDKILAEALFAFLLVQLDSWSQERVQVGKKAPKSKFIQESIFSDAFFYNLKTKGNCSLKKAHEIAESFGSKLDEALVIGLEKIREQTGGIVT